MALAQRPATPGQQQRAADVVREEVGVSSLESLNMLRPNELIREIKRLYTLAEKAGGSSIPAMLIIGPPGVGKSTAVREAAMQIASESGKVFVDLLDTSQRKALIEALEKGEPPDKYFVFLDLRLTEVEPSDLIGIPRVTVVGGREVVDYAPLEWAYILSRVPGILFLDEITNVRRNDVLAAAYKLMLDKAAGFTRFNRRTLVIAAGNPPTEYGLARPLPEPIINRSMVIYAEPPKIEEWIRWMADQISTLPEGVKEELMRTLTITSTFLTIYPTLFNNPNIPRDPNVMENMPTPRSWSFFIFTTPYSKLEELAKKGASAVAQYLSSFVGREAASRFATLFKVKIDPLEKLLQNPSTVDSYNLEQMLALAVAIADNIAYRATAARTPEEKIETTYQALKQLEPLLTKIALRRGQTGAATIAGTELIQYVHTVLGNMLGAPYQQAVTKIAIETRGREPPWLTAIRAGKMVAARKPVSEEL